MVFKKTLKRFRYYCSWRYPILYGISKKLAFPVQVLALCFVLYTAVKFYQRHYSFEATMQAHQRQTARTSQQPSPLEFEKEIPLAAAMNEMHSSPGDTVRVQRQTNTKNAVAQAPETKAAAPTDLKTSPPQRAITELFNSKWILEQDNDSFVIQLAASSDETKLKQYATDLSLSGPVAMYPFKKTTGGKLTYGLSTGLYNSDTQALSALTTLPNEVQKYGTWVRKISDIGAQIDQLDIKP